MTDKQPEALRLAELLELAPEDGIEPQTSEDAAAELRRLHTENTALQQGYAAARLEIESLQARIKTMAEEHADELMVAHLDGMRGRSTEPAGEYPALPSNAFNIDPGSGGNIRGYSADQMRAYADATCAIRAVQPASGLDPELGPMLDFANAGEIAFYDYAVAQHCRATLDILDGKDNGAGACNEPWASVRKRLLSIVELHQSSSASHGQAPAQAAPAYKDSTPELHVGDSAFENWYSTYNPAHKGDKQRARDAYAAGMGDPLVTAAPAAVAVPTFEDFCKRHGLDPKKMDGHGGMWARVALDECRATAQPAPQQDSVLEDAARYRWLRERSSTMFVNISINGEGAEIAATLDSAVDAARKQGETNEH